LENKYLKSKRTAFEEIHLLFFYYQYAAIVTVGTNKFIIFVVQYYTAKRVLTY